MASRGHGRGRAFGGVPFSPASMSLLGAWLEAVDVPATLTPAVQPAIANADFESATFGWSYFTTTVSRESGARTGGSGSYVGRFAYDGSHAFGMIYRAALIIGNKYSFSGWIRTDGVGSAAVTNGAGTTYIAVGASAAWVYVSGTFTATTNANLAIQCANLANGRWVECDDFVVVDLSRTAWIPRAGSNKAGIIAQATAAAQWWASTSKIGTHFALEFDGTADHGVSDLAASAWPLHKAATFACTFKPASGSAGTNTILDTCNATSTNVGCTIDYDPAAETLRLRVSQDGTGTWAVNDTIACAKGASHYVEIYWSSAGYSMRVDGGAATTGAITGSLSTNAATATLQVGRTSGGANFYQGLLGDVVIGLVGDAAGAANCGSYLKAEYGL